MSKLRKTAFLFLILLLTHTLEAQTIQISNKLSLIQLSENTYIHTCEGNNGIVFIDGNDALIVSMPDSDRETQILIDWVAKNKNIVGYIIDCWHTDAMEGLDIVHQYGIISYAYDLTRQIAKEKGLPIPKTGFDPKTELEVANKKVICHYLGEAHTKDGIIVWIPSEQILFGGNEIRNLNGWVGNIADASLDKWSETATRIKEEYGYAKIVVPGHGRYGGAECIDYTNALYSFDSLCKNIDDSKFLPQFENKEDFILKADSNVLQNGVYQLINALVLVQDSTKYAKIESPLVYYQPDKKQINSESGRLFIYDKTADGGKLRTKVNYKNLTLFKEDDAVGLRIILRTIVK